MALLKSVDNIPGISFYEYRDRLYYNKYKYKCNFVLLGSEYLYGIKTEQQLIRRINFLNINDTKKNLLRTNIKTLLDFIEWRETFSSGKPRSSTMRNEGSKVSVFANELSLFETLKPFFNQSVSQTFEAKAALFSGVKYFAKEPKHRYRVYLKSLSITTGARADFVEFINKQKSIYPSPSMRRWLDPTLIRRSWISSTYVRSSYSIDFDDDKILSYMMLMYSDMLGKFYKLEKHPELNK